MCYVLSRRPRQFLTNHAISRFSLFKAFRSRYDNLIIIIMGQHVRSAMAVTNFWAPAFLVLMCTLMCILEQKLCSRLEYTVTIHKGIPGSTFGFPSSSNEAVNFGMEVIYRLTLSAKNDVRLCLRTGERSTPLILLLLLGGDIELNPGHKHLCSICSKPAQPDQATNQCDVCDSWFHARCCKLPSIYIDILSRSSCTWLCPKCGRQNSKPYSSDSEVLPSSLNYFEPLFNSGILPSHSNESEPSKGNNNRRRSKGVLKNNRRKLACMPMNCRSAKNKIADIAAVIDQHKPDVIFGTESWLNSNIESNEIFPNGYKIYRKDRPDDCHGGGVFQAVKNDIIITHRSDLDTDCEIIWTQCQLADKKTKSLPFGSYYRPNSSNVSSLNELDASMLKLGNSVHKNNIIFSGDFNAPDIDWNTEYSSQSPASDRLLEIIEDHDLSQHVKEPTRRDGNTQNILDPILSNNSNIIENVSVVPGICDHDIVLFTANTSCRRRKNVKRKIYIRKKADSTRIKEELTNLSLQMDSRSFNSIDDKWSCFEDNIHLIMDSCIL